MSAELNEEQEPLTPATDETVLNELEDADLPEDKKIETILAQKKHWRDKAVNPKTGKTYKVELEELKAKQAEAQVQKQVKEVQASNYITKDEYEEGILRTSKGYNDEDIAVLNVIAKGKSVSVLQAEQDPMFALHLEKKAAEERKASAQLGASRGSNDTGTRKEPVTREEHQEMWKEKSGR